MKIRWLEFFVAVAEEQSVSRATARLNTSQAALSRAIRELEAMLNVDLFQRTGRGMMLTAEGKVLLDAAQGVLDSYAEFTATVRDISGDSVGSLRILLPMRLSAYLVRPFMTAFSDTHPRARAEIFEALNEDIQYQLRIGKADIGIYYSPLSFDDDAGERIASESLYVTGTPGLVGETERPITMKEASALPVFMQSHPASYRQLVESRFTENGYDLTVCQNLNTIDAHIQYALAGDGVTILGYSAVRRETETGALVARRIVEPEIRRDVFVRTASQVTTRLQRDAIAMLKSAVRANRDALRWEMAKG